MTEDSYFILDGGSRFALGKGQNSWLFGPRLAIQAVLSSCDSNSLSVLHDGV